MNIQRQTQILLQRSAEDRRNKARLAAQSYDRRLMVNLHINNLRINSWMERYHAALNPPHK